jgi:putative alpha-1,2-mannosidase
MTFLKICEQQDRLPVWHLVGNETDCMVGNPAIPVLADIVLKGFSVDGKAALEAMKQTAMVDGRSIGLLKKYGYIPWDKEPTNETVSKGLEYALADGALARVAKQLGDSAAYDAYVEWENKWSPALKKQMVRVYLPTDKALAIADAYEQKHRSHQAAQWLDGAEEGNFKLPGHAKRIFVPVDDIKGTLMFASIEGNLLLGVNFKF